jgi:hypothetical protein
MVTREAYHIEKVSRNPAEAEFWGGEVRILLSGKPLGWGINSPSHCEPIQRRVEPVAQRFEDAVFP